MKIAFALTLTLLATPALSQESKPSDAPITDATTITLTYGELKAILNTTSQHAMANYTDKMAEEAMRKLNAQLMPKPPLTIPNAKPSESK